MQTLGEGVATNNNCGIWTMSSSSSSSSSSSFPLSALQPSYTASHPSILPKKAHATEENTILDLSGDTSDEEDAEDHLCEKRSKGNGKRKGFVGEEFSKTKKQNRPETKDIEYVNVVRGIQGPAARRFLSFDIGWKHCAFCLVEVDGELGADFFKKDVRISPSPVRIVKWGVLDIFLNQGSNVATTTTAKKKPAMDIAVHALISTLKKDEFSWMANKRNVVIVERQVANNPLAQVLSHALQAFFQLVSNPPNVVFASPVSKFSFLPISQRKPAGSGQKKWKKHALACVKSIMATEHVEICPSLMDLYKKASKQDDLADAFLQGLSHAFTQSK